MRIAGIRASACAAVAASTALGGDGGGRRRLQDVLWRHCRPGVTSQLSLPPPLICHVDWKQGDEEARVCETAFSVIAS